MKKFRKYDLIGAIIIFTAALSLMSSQTAFGGPTKNPISLPPGTWIINADGEKGELNVTSSPDGQITGTLRFGIGLPSEYFSKIFGFWDADAWKITFLKENQVFFKNASRDALLSCNKINNITGEACHGRDVIFTGYMFGGLPCPPKCTNTGASISLGSTNAKENDALKGPSSPIIMAGTSQNFGGTGATADRNVFGWVATHTNMTLTKLPCSCPQPLAK